MEKKKSSAGKKILIAVLIIILLLLLLVLAGVLYLDRMIGLINQEDPTVPTMNAQQMEEYLNANKETLDPDFTGDVIDPEDVTWDPAGDEVSDEDSVINIMLIGQDRRSGEVRARSDTMLLCSFNKKTKELTMVSFMRDMYVQIPGHYDHKMNSAHAWGGMGLLNQTVQTNFGIEIDGDFSVDFAAFEKVIDTIGGVDIHLTANEANYLDWAKYTEGVNHLDGADALDYARIRSIGNADFSRTMRQQNVINAIIEKCKTLSLVELNDLMEAVLPLMTTNMDKATILNYAAELLPMVASIKINDRVRIPADGTYSFAWVSEMSVLMPDLEENRQLLQEALYGE